MEASYSLKFNEANQLDVSDKIFWFSFFQQNLLLVWLK